MENNKVRLIIIIGVILVIAVFVFAFILNGINGVFAVVGFIFKWIIILGVIGLVVLVVYYLFIHVKKIDVLEEVKKNIEQECVISSPYNLAFLYTTGDSEHIPVRIGLIEGFSQRLNYDVKTDKARIDKKTRKPVEIYRKESIFRVRRYSENPFKDLFRRLFSKRFLVRVPVELHDKLQGDVYIKCVSLVRHSYYFYPDSVHLNTRLIDRTIYNEGQRFNNLEVPKYSNPLIQKALGITRLDKNEIQGMTGFQQITQKSNTQQEAGK